ncbi:hypothetical protein EJB05_53068, partial [Eragrostis curvula]
MTLVEDASRRQQQQQQGRRKKKVILFGHSMGGMVALEFVRATPPAWREEYIKHLVLVAPLPASSGFTESVKYFVSGSEMLHVPATTAMSLRPMWRTFESVIAAFPSPAVFGDDKPLVVTGRRNYTARDMADLLADVGAAGAVEPFRRLELPKARRYFEPPMVPVTCVNGVGNGDGEGTINLISMLAFDEDMRREPGQRKQY